MISAGEVHLPGRPTDPKGTKALALLAHKSFSKARPAGVKVYGGALILEKGLVEADFKELSEDGVRLVGEIGLGSVKVAEEARSEISREQREYVLRQQKKAIEQELGEKDRRQ